MTSLYLLRYIDGFTSFRLMELRRLCAALNLPHEMLPEKTRNSPYIIMSFHDDEAVQRLAARSFLLKSCYRLLAQGETFEELQNNFKSLRPHFTQLDDTSASICVHIHSYHKSIPWTRRLELISRVMDEVIDHPGPVDLNNAALQIGWFEEYRLDSTGHAVELPHQFYAGLHICDSVRDCLSTFDIPRRYFIANTTMDPLLSFIMANSAGVQPGDLVLDPFVGSGSCLIACAFFGSYCVGCDIDYQLLHAESRPSRVQETVRRPDESVLANFKQYGLASYFLDIFVGDTAQHNLWRAEGLIDAIVTDPPYGVREAAKRVSSHDSVILPEQRALHVPRYENYAYQEIFCDLITLAARLLKMGGHLVFWMPALNDDSFSPLHIPSHPSLSLLDFAPQKLCNGQVQARELVTMVKSSPWIPNSRASLEINPFSTVTFRDYGDAGGGLSAKAAKKEARREKRRAFTAQQTVSDQPIPPASGCTVTPGLEVMP